MKKLMQTLFSITKNPNIKYKIISILGFKIKTINKQYVQKLEQEKLQLENDKQKYCNCLNIFKSLDKNFQDYIITNDLYEQIPKLIPHKADDMRIEVNLVDHCNLNCKFCDHFSPIAEKRFLDIKVFENDISRLAKLTNGTLGGLSLIGGEPLLHNEVSKFFEISRKYFPNTVIDMVTNGILLKNNDEVWQTLKKYNIKLLITTYPINIDYEAIDKKAKELKIAYERFFMFGTDMKEKVSVHHPFKLDGSVNKNDFIQCYHFNRCIALRDGKLYTCPIIPYSEHFNKYFNQNLTISEKDYIDIYKAKSFEEISKFLATRPMFCKYCDVTKRTGHPYGISKKSISEWT